MNRYLVTLTTIICLFVSIRLYVLNQYAKIISNTTLIHDFRIAAPEKIAQVAAKHNVEYAQIRGTAVISSTNPLLSSNLELINIARVTHPDVMTFSTEQYLQLIEPHVILRPPMIFILFPLVFEEKKDSYIVMKKII